MTAPLFRAGPDAVASTKSGPATRQRAKPKTKHKCPLKGQNDKGEPSVCISRTEAKANISCRNVYMIVILFRGLRVGGQVCLAFAYFCSLAMPNGHDERC